MLWNERWVGMLKVINVNKAFSGKQILKNISFNVQPGQIAIFLGSSGVGKSTLLRILNGLEKPDSGTLELDENSLFHVQNKQAVGMVFQQFNLFEHLSVMQNITIALEKVLGMNYDQAYAIAFALLQKYGLEDKANFPISSLSGGQKQRLAIVRSLAVNPKVICLDEPTSALDPFLTLSVAHNIQKLAQEGYIVLVSTHDMNLVKNLNGMIYLMEDGAVVEAVLSQEYFESPEKFSALNNFVRGTKIS
jgi:ABC-type polar amino acid transport system ATPase subunit